MPNKHYLDLDGLSAFLGKLKTAYAGNDTETYSSAFSVGLAGKASQLETARTIGLSGDVSATAVSFDGTQNITIATTIADVQASTSGAGGSHGLMTAAQAEKLAGVDTGAQVNVIETVKVNGSALTPDANKAVDITIPAATVTDVQTKTTDAGSYATVLDGTVAKIDLSVYALKSDITSVLDFKGTKSTASELPTSDVKVGDVWVVSADNSEYVCTAISPSVAWEKLGPVIDLSGYVQTSRTINNKALSSDITLDGSDVALSSNYAVASSAAAPASGDSLDTAVGKLQAEIATKANSADLGTAAAEDVEAFVPASLTPAEAGAQVNVIEGITINGASTGVSVSNKIADLTITADVADVQTSTDGSTYATVLDANKVAKIDLSSYLTSSDISNFIELGDLSVDDTATGAYVTGLSYDNTTGEFTTTKAAKGAVADSDTGLVDGDTVYDYIEGMAITSSEINALFPTT